MRRLKPKIRISKTAIKMWVAGDIQGLEDYYNEVQATNKYMERGKVIHEALEICPPIKDLNRLCGEGGAEVERKIELNYKDIVLVGVVDRIHNRAIVDWKSSRTKSKKDAIDIKFYQFLLSNDRTGYVIYTDETLEVKDVLPVPPLGEDEEIALKLCIDELTEFLQLYFKDILI